MFSKIMKIMVVALLLIAVAIPANAFGKTHLEVLKDKYKDKTDLTASEQQEVTDAYYEATQQDLALIAQNPDCNIVYGDKKVANLKGKTPKVVGMTPKSIGTRKGQFWVTAYSGIDNIDSGTLKALIGHSGLVYSSSFVLESYGNKVNQNGVRFWPNDWDTRYPSHTYLRSVSSTTVAQDAKAADYAYWNWLGYPYNWNFFNISTRSSFYCYQLIYAAFIDTCGVNLDPSGLPITNGTLIGSTLCYTVWRN